MLKNRRIVFLLLTLVILIFTMSSIAAENINETTTNNMDYTKTHDNDNINKVIQTSPNNEVNDKILSSKSVTKVPEKSTKQESSITVNNLGELNSTIGWFNSNSETGTIILAGDEIYSFNGENNSISMDIETNLTIIGQGRTLSGKGISEFSSNPTIFNIIEGANVTITNLKFDKNKVNQYSSIHNKGNLTLDNVTFTNINGTNSAGAIYTQGDLYVKNSFFENVSKIGVGYTHPGVIYIHDGKALIENSNFTNCNSNTDGGIIGITNLDDDVGSPTVTIRGCKFENGYSINEGSQSKAGAIRIAINSNVTIENNSFINNSAMYGGAIYIGASGYMNTDDVLIKNNTFIENTALYGGAISVDNNVKTNITENRFIRNNGNESDIIKFSVGSRGGAISIFGNDCGKIYDNYFQENTASGGGAIYVDRDGKVIVEENTFKNNYVEKKSDLGNGYGGAIFCYRSTIIINGNNITGGHAITGDTIINNRGTIISNNNNISKVNSENGAILYNAGEWNSSYDLLESCSNEYIIVNSADFKIENGTFRNNTAIEGGVLYSWGTLEIINSSLTYNKAVNGSAIYNEGTYSLDNVTLLDNQANANKFDDVTLTKDGNKLTLKAAFIGNNNELNGIWNNELTSTIKDVKYWGHDGVNTISGDIRHSDHEEGINITIEGYDQDNQLLFNTTVKTDENGFFSIDCPCEGDASEAYAFKFYHIEDTYYTFLEDSIIRNITHLDVEVSNISYTENETINIHVSSENPEYTSLLTGTVNVTITFEEDGIERNVTLDTNQYEMDSNKNVQLNVSGLNVSNYTVNVRYNGDGYHIPSYATAFFEVSKINSTVNITIPNYDYGDITQNMTINLNQTSEKYPGNVSVTITSATLNEHGQVDFNHTWTRENIKVNNFNITIDELLNAGDYNATIIFSGTNNYLNSSNITKFKVNKQKVLINVTALNVTFEEQSNITTVITPSLARGTINITVSNDEFSLEYYNLELDEATLVKTIILLPIGEYDVLVKYSGDENYASNQNKTKFHVRDKNKTIITINDIYDTTINKTITISGLLKDVNGELIRNTKINLTINDIRKEISVNQKGEYSLNYTPHTSGEKQVIIEYIGNTTYYGTKISKTFNVNKIPTKTIADYVNTTIGNVVINVKVTNNSGSPVGRGHVKVYDNKTGLLLGEGDLTKGEANITLTVNSPGHLGVNVTYDENNIYLSSNAIGNKDKNTNITECEVIKQKATINIELNPKVTVLYDNVYIEGTVLVNNKPITSGKVNINVHGKIIPVDINKDGSYNLTYNAIKAGNYIVNATYPGNTNISAVTSNDVNFTVEKIPTKTNLKIVNSTYGNVQVEVIVTNVTGTPITTGTVNVTFANGTVIKEVNLAGTGGKVLVNIPTTSLDDLLINASYVENDKYASSNSHGNTGDEDKENITVIKVTPLNPTISIEINDNNVTYGEKVIISGKVTNSTGQPAPKGEKVILTINNTIMTVTIVTDGVYELEYPTTDVGEFNVNAYYKGARNNTKFNVLLADAIISMNPISNVYVQDNVTITGKLVDKQQKPIAYQTITITVNGETYTAVTDKEGNYNQTVPNAREGKNNVTISYKSEKYNPTSITGTFNARKLKVFLIVDSVKGIVGEDIALVAHLTDEKGNNVTGGNIVFKLNGRTLREDGRFDTNSTNPMKIHVENGLVIITIKADLYLRAGKNITASYSGSSRYESAKGNIAEANIIKRTAKLNVTTIPVTAKQNTDIVFTTTLKDVTRKATNTTCITTDAYVIFKVNGKTLKDKNAENIKVPVTSTVVNYVYHVPSATAGVDNNGNIRNYSVECVYANDLFYPDTRNKTVYHVQRSIVNINFIKTTVVNGKLKVKAKLTDYENNNLVGINKICIKINGVTYKDAKGKTIYFNVKDGNIDLSGIKLAKGTSVKSVMIVTGTRQAYLSARASTTDITT